MLLRAVLALSLLAAPAVGQPVERASSLYDARFDDDIRAGVREFWKDYPYWRAAKAQWWQESRLRTDAVSPVKARGPAQFMPKTWEEVTARLGTPGKSPHSRYAFRAGAYYMAQQRASLRRRGAVDPDLHRLALAAYNAGLGNVYKAMSLCDDSVSWATVETCFPSVTGRHAAETRGYVPRIARYCRDLETRAGVPEPCPYLPVE